MDKFEYFCLALKAGCAGRPHWVSSVFSAMEHAVYDVGVHKLLPDDAPDLQKEQAKTYPYRIFRISEDSDALGFIVPGKEGDYLSPIGKAVRLTPLLNFSDRVFVSRELMSNAPEVEQETCYGNIITNWLLLYLPFGNKIPFVFGKTDGGSFDDLVQEKYARDNPPVEERDPNLIYMSEYHTYQKNAAYMDMWSEFATASVTINGLTAQPEITKFFKTKLSELGRPPTVTELARIEEEAAKLDKALFKGTEDENFLTGKNYKVNRKKMVYIYGLEEGFGKSTIIIDPLSAGIKAKDLPDYSNALRAASHNRGAQTALGGVGVKRANQIFQAVRIASQDCGDKLGYNYITYNVKDLYGTYVFMEDGVRIPSPTEAEALVGKQIRIRSPMSCIEGSPHYCATCAGLEIAMLPFGVHNTIAAINSAEMIFFMKAMHGRSLSTVPFSPLRSMS